MATEEKPTYQALAIEIDVLCDRCQAEVKQGETAYVHSENGELICEKCQRG